MIRIRNFARPTAPGSLIAVILLCALAQAQFQSGRSNAAATSNDPQTLQTILQEVQQTRQAVQRSMTILYRGQTLLAEARLRYEQINHLQKELDQLRAEAIEDQSESQRSEERLRDLAVRIASEQSAQQLESLRAEEIEVRLLMQERSQEETLRQEREALVNKNLLAEKAKLAELTRQISDLERELAAPIKQEKSRQ